MFVPTYNISFNQSSSSCMIIMPPYNPPCSLSQLTSFDAEQTCLLLSVRSVIKREVLVMSTVDEGNGSVVTWQKHSSILFYIYQALIYFHVICLPHSPFSLMLWSFKNPNGNPTRLGYANYVAIWQGSTSLLTFVLTSGCN